MSPAEASSESFRRQAIALLREQWPDATPRQLAGALIEIRLQLVAPTLAAMTQQRQ